MLPRRVRPIGITSHRRNTPRETKLVLCDSDCLRTAGPQVWNAEHSHKMLVAWIVCDVGGPILQRGSSKLDLQSTTRTGKWARAQIVSATTECCSFATDFQSFESCRPNICYWKVLIWMHWKFQPAVKTRDQAVNKKAYCKFTENGWHYWQFLT